MNNQAADIQASRIRIASTDEVAAALDSAGLRLDRAVIVLVGGAGTMSTRLPAIRWQRAKTPDATPEPDLCPMCRAPFLYAQATAVRTAVLM